MEKYRYSILLVLVLFPLFAFAWGYKGHVLISQIAYENLTPPVKKEVTVLSDGLFDQLPQRLQRRLDRYQGVSNFARLSVLPDAWRRWKLKTIFQKNGAPIPTVLQPYAYDRTASWHFINQPYPNRQCHTVKAQNVVWAIGKVEQALKQSKNSKTKGILLVMLALSSVMRPGPI